MVLVLQIWIKRSPFRNETHQPNIYIIYLYTIVFYSRHSNHLTGFLALLKSASPYRNVVSMWLSPVM